MNDHKLKVFVYGTLKVGGYFASQLDGLRIRSERAILPNATLHSLGAYPSISTAGGTGVVGEYHEYADPEYALRVMDYIEGYTQGSDSNLFNRKSETVVLESGEKVKALVYEYADTGVLSGAPTVESGEWPI